MRWLPPPGWKRRLAIAAALVLTLRAVLATVIERVAEDRGTRALGVPLRIGDVDLALWRGSIAVDQLRVGHKGQPLDAEEVQPGDALFSLERLGVRISWLDLLRGRIRLRELELLAPNVQVAREADGSIAPLPEQPPAPPEEEAAAEGGSEGGALPLAIDHFALRDGRVGLIAAEDPGHELLGFGLEELTLADFRLDQDGIALGAIGIRRPELRVHERFAFGEAGSEPAEEPPPVGAAPAASGETAGTPAFRVEHIAIERAAFTLQMENSALDLALALSADDVSAKRGHAFPAKLRLEVARGTLEAEGQVGIDPPLFDGTLRWQGLAVPVLLEPLPAGPTDSLEAATASGDLKILAQLAPPDGSAPEVRVSGSIALTDVAARDPAQDLSLGWKALEIEIDELRAPLAAQGGGRPAPPRLALRKLRLVEPSARMVLAKAEPVPETPEIEPASEPPVDAGPAPAQPQVSIASLEIVGGRVDFVDRNVDPEYKAQLRRVALGARDVRWPEGDLRDLRAGFTGPAEAVLDLRGTMDNRSGEMRLKIDRLAVPGFNPYARSAGVELSRGDLSLDTRAKGTGDAWSLSNDLRLHELSLARGGSENVPSVGLPLSAVLALLRDANGNIKLSIPVEVEGRLVRAGIGAIVLSAFRQALAGVVSSPLKVLGLASGSGEAGAEQPAALACEPGSMEPAEGEKERVREIAALLAEHPTLGLVLRGRAGDADVTPLAEQLLHEQIEAGNEPELPDSGFLQRRRLRSALESRARGESDGLEAEDRPALERWIAATPVPPERVQALAAERAEVLLALLVDMHGIARERLSLADPLEGDPAVALEISAVPGS